MDELPACPFCGNIADPGHNEVTCTHGFTGDPDLKTCANDGIYTVEQWIARPLEDALRAELAAAREEIAALKAEHRWIPVSERLPEEPDYYLVIYSKDYDGSDFYGCEYYAQDDGFTDDVFAWQPLPPPPEA